MPRKPKTTVEPSWKTVVASKSVEQLARVPTQEALSISEARRLPAVVLVAWCVYCQSTDYAFGVTEKPEELQCPRCEHQQTLIPYVLAAGAVAVEPA